MKVSKASMVFALFALVALCASVAFFTLYVTECTRDARDGYRYCGIAMLMLAMLFCFIASVTSEHTTGYKY